MGHSPEVFLEPGINPLHMMMIHIRIRIQLYLILGIICFADVVRADQISE